MESKTPRTDAEFKLEAFFDGSGIVETVFVEFARELETELADKDKQLAEARAEIENLQWQINNEKAKSEAALELNGKALELVNEARARIDHLKRIIDEMTEEQASLCAEGQSITELVAAKDKLIEQMRAALRAWVRTPDIPLHEAIRVTEAALEAAERGE